MDDDGACNSTLSSDFTVLQRKKKREAAVQAGDLAASTGSSSSAQRILVMIIDYSDCGARPGVSESDVRKIYLGSAQDGNGGAALRFRQCSYGKFNVSETSFRVVTVEIPCSNLSIAKCISWANAPQPALSRASRILGINDLGSRFTQFVYVLPPAMDKYCYWHGAAAPIPGKHAWLQTNDLGVRRWATIMQEALHGFGGYEKHGYVGSLRCLCYLAAVCLAVCVITFVRLDCRCALHGRSKPGNIKKRKILKFSKLKFLWGWAAVQSVPEHYPTCKSTVLIMPISCVAILLITYS